MFGRRSGLRTRFTRFLASEEASMTVFSIFLLLAMLIVGGMAVDMMRHETYRTQLQATLDRCALAAADLDQTVNPDTVVRDCFQKAGFARQLRTVQVRRSATTSAVQVTAEVILPTIFMRMAGITTLSAPASAAAEEAVSNIEVSLVLDISGSMRFNDRLTNLKPAARDFVTQVLTQSNGVAASINLVPYAGATNPGVTMFDYLGGVRYSQRGRPNAFTNVSSCLEIPATAFGRTGLPPRGLAQTPHFMMWAIDSSVMDWGWCPEDDTSIIYASDNERALHNAINGIRMHDGTGTHFAMKWGVALLDPTTRTAFNHLADRGEVPRQFRDRPRAWADRDTQKFVVLMTDGQITEQVRPVNPTAAANTNRELERRNGNERRNLTTAAQNVTSFYASCDAAKANGVIVYTIAFEAPDPGPAEMARCASSPSHFFDANGKEEIADAFRSIANQINALRLTR